MSADNAIDATNATNATKEVEDAADTEAGYINPEYSEVALEEQLLYRSIAAADLIDPRDAPVFSTN